jgi:hypothetical protein
LTGAVDPPASGHGAAVVVDADSGTVVDDEGVGVVVTRASVVTLVDGTWGVEVVADLPPPPPHEASISANTVMRRA